MDDSSLMPFGKHKGEKMANVPASYLLWLYEQGITHTELRKYVFVNIDVLRDEVEKEKAKKR